MKNNDTLPLVSIMIPTYNQAKVLRKTIDSALIQDYKKLEIVVADDGSIDETESVVKRIDDSRIRYHKNVPNMGRVSNYRHTLYEIVRGEWVLNLDGDDLLVDPGFISAAVQAVTGKENVVLVSADRYEMTIPEDDMLGLRNTDGVKPKYMDGTEFVLSLPKSPWRIYHLTSLYNRKLAMETDFYRKDIISSDYESLWRLAMSGTIAYIPAKVAIWRRHSENVSRSGDIEQLKKNYVLFDSVYNYAISQKGGKKSKCFSVWHQKNVAKRYYTSLLSLFESRNQDALKELSSFLRDRYPRSFRIVLTSPKTWIKLLVISLTREKRNL
jgi:glycosyltransferase involved in cell wall biosynthesis